MSAEMWMDEARQLAAQCWCDSETSDRVMDPTLAEAVARRIASWMETAAQFAKNEDFYRRILDRCARSLGPEVFVSDDGSIQDSPLRLKIPELIERLVQDREHPLALLSRRVHAANAKWWRDLVSGEPITRNVGELLMLAVSELAEALEGHRKDLRDDKLPHRAMFEVEIADCIIRLLDTAAGLKLDLAGAFEEKMAFNARRVDHSIEHRLAPGGKKY